eukprot:5295262-Prymnesium_polylepis.1
MIIPHLATPPPGQRGSERGQVTTVLPALLCSVRPTARATHEPPAVVLDGRLERREPRATHEPPAVVLDGRLELVDFVGRVNEARPLAAEGGGTVHALVALGTPPRPILGVHLVMVDAQPDAAELLAIARLPCLGRKRGLSGSRVALLLWGRRRSGAMPLNLHVGLEGADRRLAGPAATARLLCICRARAVRLVRIEVGVHRLANVVPDGEDGAVEQRKPLEVLALLGEVGVALLPQSMRELNVPLRLGHVLGTILEEHRGGHLAGEEAVRHAEAHADRINGDGEEDA